MLFSSKGILKMTIEVKLVDLAIHLFSCCLMMRQSVESANKLICKVCPLQIHNHFPCGLNSLILYETDLNNSFYMLNLMLI
jgi:hypothetical protein